MSTKKKNQKCCFLRKQTLSGITVNERRGCSYKRKFLCLIRSFHTTNNLGLKLEMVTLHTYIICCLILP